MRLKPHRLDPQPNLPATSGQGPLHPGLRPASGPAGKAEPGHSGAPWLLGYAAALLASSAAAVAFREPLIPIATAGALATLSLLDTGRQRLAESWRRSGPRRRLPEGDLDRHWEAGEGTAQISALFDALGDMFVVLTPEGRVLHANMTLRVATGCEHPDGRSLAAIGIDPAPGANGLEVRTGSGDDMRIWTWHQTAARDMTTGELRIHGIGRDVTADRKAGAVAAEAKARAEAENAAKTRFLATVSHEIRTPLNGILGMTHLLSQTEITPEQASYLRTVRDSGHALLTLIEDLLDATSIEAGRFHLRHGTCDPHELVQSACELMAAQAHEKGIEIASHVAPDVPRSFVSDPGRLKQVLFNLIGNAAKFTERGGILVDVARSGEMLVISVSDTGPGLRPEDQKRIFEEFERADNSSTRRHGGAGLGLHISARIVAALGGAIGVDSEPGKGSRFHFTIPLTLADEPAEASDPAPLAGKRALIVGPEGPVSTTLKQAIAERGGLAETACGLDDLDAAVERLRMAGGAVTDLILDRRLAVSGEGLAEAIYARVGADVDRTLLIAPEDSRDLRLSPDAAAHKWLVRPVRAKSLVNVLTMRDDRDERSRAAGPIGTPALMRPSDTPTFDILLAEDNPVNAFLVRTMLAREGHRVTLVEDGVSFVDESLERPDGICRYDLAITDISMPRLDGRNAIVQIRSGEAAEGFSRLPIIVLSAEGESERRDDVLAAGADAYAEKPIDPNWLGSLVAMTAGPGRAARA